MSRPTLPEWKPTNSARQCFIHEDGFFAAGSEAQEQPGCACVPEVGANTIFIEKRRSLPVKKVSTLYIKSFRWYDLKLDARGTTVLISVENYG